jgi:uncharacterized protein (TIRG00374 family)
MKNKGFVLRIVISACLIALLLWMVDIHSLVAVIKGTRPGVCVLFIIVALCDRAFMAFKWNVLVRAIGIRITFFESLRVYFTSSFMGMFFPTSVGSDILRLFIVGVDKNRREAIAASIVVERFVAFMALVLLFIMMAACALFYFSFTRIGLIAGAAAAIFIASALIFFVSLYHVPVSAFNRFTGKIGNILRKVLISYQLYRERKMALAIFFGLSFVEHFFPIACNFLAALALHININTFAFFVIIPLVLVFTRLPISLDGIGIQEGLYWALFQQAGASPAEAFSLALIVRALTMVALLPGGIMFIFHRRTKESVRA